MKLILISPWTACGFLRTVVPWRKKERRPKVRKVHGGRERRARASKGLWGLCFNSSPESFSARVSGTLVVYELSATVIHLVARHAFAADISVRVCGKKLSPRRDKKNPNATSDEFSRLENFSLIGDTRGEGGILEWKKEEKKNRNSFPPYLIEVLRNLYFIQIFFKSLFFSLSLL